MFRLPLLWPVALGFLLGATLPLAAVTPPVVRSTEYNGAYSNIVHYPVQPWMNSASAILTVEAWVYCNDLDGVQAFVARHYTTNLWFGLIDNQLRFYRSGGTFVDSDGALAARRWTHVAVSYDGSFARFYIDGANAGVKSLASAGNTCTNSLSLGGQHDALNLGDLLTGGYAFNGLLDEVRLWSVARSSSAIAANRNSELRSGTGLLATFGTGGSVNDIGPGSGLTGGIPIANRWSGFGILPSTLCVPYTGNTLTVDATIDLLNEYRGAETLVLRSTTSPTTPDERALLMVSTNASNYHLYVGVPALPQVALPRIPVLQIQADADVSGGNTMQVGDWRCEIDQESFQGGSVVGVSPPLFPSPTWFSWPQGVSNWQGLTAEAFEFHQNYEFRIHARYLNYFTNSIGLMVRYFDIAPGNEQLAGPRGAVTNVPTTYARVNWCGRADSDLSSVTFAGSITNLSGNQGVSGRTVSLYSGDSELTGFLLSSTTTDSQGRFSFAGILAPMERRLTVTYSPPGGILFLDPAIDSSTSARVPVAINSPSSVTFAPCPTSCLHAKVNFRYRSLGPVGITGVLPPAVPASVVVRTSPLKTTAATTVTVTGTNFHPGIRVYFRGSGCALIPPSLCTGDFHEAAITSQSIDGLSLVAQVPSALTGVDAATRSFQIVVDAGSGSWVYGPSLQVTPPLWPQLHGFEFINRDDGPSIEEFEACYGDSIFNFLRIREPYYGIWALVYLAWMDGCKGSCYGFSGTSRLMADGSLPATTYDVPGGNGVHGVRFANGYIGTPACDISGALCPPKPYRWTGFDLFQPFRPVNLWGRITSLAGAQTSAEALGVWLSQLQRPVAFGPRRGWAVADPVDVLNRVRSDPGGYTACVYTRDLGAGHCVTPYGVIDGMGLDAGANTPITAAAFSLIKIYDNNWPQMERYIEVNRTDNTFRYNSGLTGVGLHEGAGLFYVPMSVYRNARHAPDPFFLGSYGIDFLRFLTAGTSSAGMLDAGGGQVGWEGNSLTNGYEGALTYVPPGLLEGTAPRIDTTMLFLPANNPPDSGAFRAAGGNVMLYGAMGWGDIAFGFNSAGGVRHTIDGISFGPDRELLAMGVRTGGPVTGFGVLVAGRDDSRQSRAFIIDAGVGAVRPDLHVERNGFQSLILHNRGPDPFPFRLNLAGTDTAAGTFEYAYESYSLPGHSTLTLRLPDDAAEQTLTRELDLGSDGGVDSVVEVPANGQLRIEEEGAGLLALRWRAAGFGETLEATTTLAPGEWSPVSVPVTTEGPDRVARVTPEKPAEFFRLRLDGTNCLSLSSLPPGAKPNPWATNGVRFEAFDANGGSLSQNTIARVTGHTGLGVLGEVRIVPVSDCDVVHVEVYQTSGFVTLEAVGSLGVVVGRRTLTDESKGPEVITFRAFRGRVQYVRVMSPNGACLILNVCCERTPTPEGQEPPLSNFLDFSDAETGQYQSPFNPEGVIVTADPGPVIIGPLAGLPGKWLKLAGETGIRAEQTDEPCEGISVLVLDPEGGVRLTAFNANNQVVSTAGPLPPSDTPQWVALRGSGITGMTSVSNSDKAFLQQVCCGTAADP